MAPSSSSTRKAARLAQKGKGRRVRFQGGTLFPLVVAIVLVLGVALIVYARSSRPENVAPQPGVDHWHGAYGFQLCTDEPTIQLTGDLEELDANGNLVDQNFATSGVHSHEDGIIHWHPYGSRASGRNARLGVFFDNYGVDVTDTRLALPNDGFTVDGAAPDADFPTVYDESETQCDGEDATLKVVVWEDFNDPGSSQVYTSAFDEIRFEDGIAVTVAFVPNDVDVEMPAWASGLNDLSDVDAGDVPPVQQPVGSDVPGSSEPSSSAPVDSAPAGATTPQDSEPETTEPESTSPESTEADPTDTTGVETTEG